jgi:hypothetical protein
MVRWHEAGEVEKQRQAGDMKRVDSIQDIGTIMVPAESGQQNNDY